MPGESTYPHGEVFLDARGQGRALRLTWHHEADVVVLSLWRERVCAGTFRLSTADVDEFVDALVDGLRDTPADDIGGDRPRPIVPHTGAIDVTPPAPAQPALEPRPAQPAGPAPQVQPLAPTAHAETAADEGGFVEWALSRDDGRATA
jgi:hypothetical protein